MAYGDEKRPSGIVDTRIKPEGPQFPPRPYGFEYKKEIEKEIKKRLPAMPYVPTQADEAMDDSPEAKAMVFRSPKAKISPPKPAPLDDKVKSAIGKIRKTLRYDEIQGSFWSVVLLGETPAVVEGRVDSESERKRPYVRRDPASVARNKLNLLSWYREIFSRPAVRQEVEKWLRQQNPRMKTGLSTWELVSGEWVNHERLPWIRKLTKLFVSEPPSINNLFDYDTLYHEVFGNPK